ncbi:hypothetical protein K4K54_006953 [Colletotrichum sp. SAR 10_86]|nr:hypothetical protein KHU50_007552 [Colletotrichum sp. SAR 10_65]KAI8201977.1 hypothetical protein K4K52_006746 [Colletotrichum sp. SAR 10_76]KAI8222383.1 hypothetical protein K4K54_006953 [Colletotrichum sp. SAR 10_86]KAI8223665.1 hypothetical protein K4K53_006769 [Colletotrichum sp. SAR 10_77]KAJ4997507.1 hypothetical protein K4K48_006845 [Colletotrichum sp. SAR 10_66]
MSQLSEQAVDAIVVDIDKMIAEVISANTKWLASYRPVRQYDHMATAAQSIVDRVIKVMNETREMLHWHANNGKKLRKLKRYLGKNDKFDKNLRRALELHDQWDGGLTEELKELTSWRDECRSRPRCS